MDGFQGQSIDQLKVGVLYNVAIGSWTLLFFWQMVEDPLQLLRIKCVADEQGDGVLGELLFSNLIASLMTGI